MAGNDNLHMSKSGKQDEFYTQLSTIEDELKHYRPFLKIKLFFVIVMILHGRTSGSSSSLIFIFRIKKIDFYTL